MLIIILKKIIFLEKENQKAIIKNLNFRVIEIIIIAIIQAKLIIAIEAISLVVYIIKLMI